MDILLPKSEQAARRRIIELGARLADVEALDKLLDLDKTMRDDPAHRAQTKKAIQDMCPHLRAH